MSQLTEVFTKAVPTTEGTIFQLQGSPSSGVVITIANLDLSNPITYKFQDSNDGSTWTDHPFTACGSTTPVTTFTVPPQEQHVIKLNPGQQYTRLRGSSGAGNISQFTISRVRQSPTDAATTYFVVA